MKRTQPDKVIVTCLRLELFSLLFPVVLVSNSKGVWFPACDQSNSHFYEACYTFVMGALMGGDCYCYSLTFLLKHSKKTQQEHKWKYTVQRTLIGRFLFKADNLKIIRANLLFIPHCQVSIKQKHKGLWEWGISDRSLLNLTATFPPHKENWVHAGNEA